MLTTSKDIRRFAYAGRFGILHRCLDTKHQEDQSILVKWLSRGRDADMDFVGGYITRARF